MHAPSAGLTASEAQARLRQFGPNASEETEDHRLRTVVASIASEPMFLLLLAAAAVYLVVGDLGEGALLGFFAALSVGLVMWQQYRGETALQALRALAVRHVRVVRDGVVQRIPSAGVVPGDLMLVAEGERVAADAVLQEGHALQVDESLLTGESVPVTKCPDPTAPDDGVPGGDSAHLFAGTLVVAGHGVGCVTSTGRQTQMGRIGTSLASIETEPTPLQRELGRLVRRFGWLAMALCGCLVLWYGLARQDWVQGLLSALAFAMAMLPEEFPMVLTIFIGMAAWRMARLQVLARRPAVVEALGATTVLCVDKTGTLTENRQTLQWLAPADGSTASASATSLPPAAQALLEHAVLASRRGGVDPLDLAVIERGDALIGAAQRHAGWQLEREYALAPEVAAMSQVWLRADGVRVVATKGAAEAVARLCHLDAPQRRALAEKVETLAERGLRVLAVAGGQGDGGEALPDRQEGLALVFLGLVGFEDPLRVEVPQVVAEARAAGIAVLMITGDHVATALAIARQAGIDTRCGALTGEQLAAMGPEALRQAVRQVRVFARIQPHQKLALVQALQAEGGIVAMTGDGVNDAPALKAAHIGIAMGKRGTDVAREAAGLVLLDEKLTSILAGVRAGRRTFDNLRHAATYIVAVHVPIAGLALLPLLFGLPPLLLPAHVVLTEMVVDPMCSFAFEGVAARDDIMRRPPRPARDALVGRATLRQGVLEGALLLAAVLVVAFLGLRWLDEAQARTLSVVALTTGNLLLVWVNTGPHGRRAPAQRALVAISAASVLVVLAAVLWEPLRSLLRFAVPPAAGLLAAAATAAMSVALASVVTGALQRRGDRAVAAPARADRTG